MERRHLTLMFTDIVGYSQLMGKNEHQTIGLVDEYRRILLSRIQAFNGEVIEFIGDAVFASFDTPLDAVNAGTAIQNDLQSFNEQAAGDTPPLRTRIGIHSGDVTLKDGAPFGDDVNVAARLEPLAVADGICISEPVYQAVKSDIRTPIKALGVRPLKNIEGKLRTYLIRPKGITYSTHAHYAVRTFQQKIEAYRYPLAIALVCLIAAGFYLVPRWLVPGYTANYVEIADFKNLMSEGGEADYFSAGITEALRSQLADMEDVYILDPSKGVRGPVRLEGSVQRIGESLRIAYRLFRRKDNVQIAGGKLDGAYDDIFILQDRVVAEVGQYLAKEFDLKFFRPAALNLTSDVTAYDYYLKGMEYFGRPETQENFDIAIKYFSTALIHDTEFSRADAGICRAYHGKFKLENKMELLDRAEDYCIRALSIDSSISEIYFAMGAVHHQRNNNALAVNNLVKALNIDPKNKDASILLSHIYRDLNRLDEAEDIFRSLLDVHPNYWRVYYDYSYFLISEGRVLEGVGLLKEVLKITPENEPALSNIGGSYLYLGEFDIAANFFEQAANVSPSSIAFSNAGSGHYYSGDFEKSVEAFKKAIKLSPADFRLYVNLADALYYAPNMRSEVEEKCLYAIQMIEKYFDSEAEYSYEVFQYLSVAYLRLGEFEKAEYYIGESRKIRPGDIDTLYTLLRVLAVSGQVSEALDVFSLLAGKGYPLQLIEADPDLNGLRQTDGFRKTLETINFIK